MLNGHEKIEVPTGQGRFYLKHPDIDYPNLRIIGDRFLGIEYSLQICESIRDRDAHIKLIDQNGLFSFTVSCYGDAKETNWDVPEMDDKAAYWMIFYDSRGLAKLMSASVFHESALSFAKQSHQSFQNTIKAKSLNEN